jgi:aerobic carbon-monoxide dehydrogenase medium subunit
MYPSAFDYHRPGSVDEAIQLLQNDPEAKILAGGHSLLPIMKLRLATPTALIDLTRISDLKGVSENGNELVIGATTTYSELMESEAVRQKLPMLVEAADQVGDVQVRNVGTIGGAIAHADPASDFPAVLLALGAKIKVVGPNGDRTIDADDCFIDMFVTDVQPDEVVTEIRIPVPGANTGAVYEKFENPASGYAIVGVAAVVTKGSDGKAESVRAAVTGAGPVAQRLTSCESELNGQELTDENIKAAAEKATEGMDFLGDIHASEEYREHLTRVFAARAIKKAAERAG